MTLHFRPIYSVAIFGLFLSFAAQASIPHPTEAANKREVRVKLGEFSRISISGYDLILNSSIQLSAESAFHVRCITDQDGSNFVEFGSGQRSAEKLEIAAPTGFFHFNNKLYRDRVTIHSQNGNCLVVNTLDLEKYLAGLLNKEMSPSWPIEALKAQAVASRSYALHQMSKSRFRSFDLESTTQDQVYDGASSETPRSNLAVEETKGLVLTSSTSPLKAYFHANCGGMTEVPSSVWGRSSKEFRPVACPYHQKKRDKMNWSFHLSRAQLDSALRKISGLLPRTFLRVAALEAGAPNANQRMNDVVLSDEKGNNLILSANAFRNAIGNTRVKSTSFQIEKEKGGYRIVGKGFGHGVGMCQIGARAMAEKGKTFQQILSHYYPLAKIRRF